MKNLLLLIIFFSQIVLAEKQKLIDVLNNGNPDKLEEVFISGVVQFITDDEIEARAKGESIRVAGRDQEAGEILDVLARIKSRAPVLVAPPGVGKTAIAQRAAQLTLDQDYPKEKVYADAFADAYWIATSPSRLSRLHKKPEVAVELFFDAVLELEKKHGIKILTFVDEFHTFDKDQVEALLPYLDSNRKTISILGATNSDKLNLAFKDNQAFLRRIKPVPVVEFDDATTLKILKETWIPRIEKYYGIKFDERAMLRFIKLGLVLYPDGGKIDAGIKIAMDSAIWQLRRLGYEVSDKDAAELANRALGHEKSKAHSKDATADVQFADSKPDAEPVDDPLARFKMAKGKAVKKPRPVADPVPAEKQTEAQISRHISEDDMFQFFKEKTGYPVNPYKPAELENYLHELETKISAKIHGQPRMVKDVLEIYRNLIIGTKKDMVVIVIAGPTGTGKSQVAKELAKHGFNNPRSLLTIDGNEYMGDEGNVTAAIRKLLGAEGGLVTSHQRSGILPDYFDDPSQGKHGGVILFDEAEKAGEAFWKRMMEFFENGSFVGGDGKRRTARRHVVILTVNRGDNILFPPALGKWSGPQIDAYVDKIEESAIRRVFTIKTSGRDNKQLPAAVLNRVDRYTVSGPMHKTKVDQVTINYLNEKLREIHSDFEIEITADPKIAERLANVHYDLTYGIRPIERAVDLHIAKIKDHLLKIGLRELRGKKMQLQFVAGKDGDSVAMEIEKNVAGKGATGFASDKTVDGKEILHNITLPRMKNKEPLLDPETAEKIQRMRTILPKHVIGQDDAIERTIEAVTGWLMMPMEDRRGFGIIYTGPTGVGKTELSKALDEALFDRKGGAEIIPFGEVADESKLNRIIGSPPGYVGSEEIRALERALMNLPEGGVIALDEILNMGDSGGDREASVVRKEAMFKRIYDIFEEGKWTSSATGVTYDLRKYLFILTGNDGAELFKGINSDQIRMRIWKDVRPPEKVRQMLMEKGVPEPFFGRMADAIFFKPLLRSESEAIAQKMTEKIFERLTGLGFKLQPPATFNKELARFFFTPGKGGRSLRDIAEYRLNSLISTALVDAKVMGQIDPKDIGIEITIDSAVPKMPYLNPGEDPGKVGLTVVVKQLSRGTVIHKSHRDLTDFAWIDKRLPKNQALATSFHEAGHAVTNDPRVSGDKLVYVTILGDTGNLGFAQYEKSKESPRYTADRASAIQSIARLLAGQVAMVMAGFSPDNGWSSDLSRARKLAQKMILEWGLEPEIIGLMSSGHRDQPVLNERQIQAISEKIETYIAEGALLAEKHLTENWGLVQSVVNQLMTDGFVTEEQFAALQKKWIEDKKNAGKAPAKISGSDFSAQGFADSAPPSRKRPASFAHSEPAEPLHDDQSLVRNISANACKALLGDKTGKKVGKPE